MSNENINIKTEVKYFLNINNIHIQTIILCFKKTFRKY